MTVQILLNLLVKMPGDAVITCVADIRASNGEWTGSLQYQPKRISLYKDDFLKRCYLYSDYEIQNPLQV